MTDSPDRIENLYDTFPFAATPFVPRRLISKERWVSKYIISGHSINRVFAKKRAGIHVE